jgi:hypothetical protein
MIDHDLALAMCGAGDGPFVDKVASRAWDALRGVADIYEASDAVESMIKETYQEFGQIYQPGTFPQAELIYGITIGGQSRLFQASGPLVNEKSYASSGIGYYLADFLAGRMGASGEHGWLTTRQCVAVAAYILFQAKEHVEPSPSADERRVTGDAPAGQRGVDGWSGAGPRQVVATRWRAMRLAVNFAP